MDKLIYDPLDDEDICSNCFEDEVYDFGLCVDCVETALEEIEEMFAETIDNSISNVIGLRQQITQMEGN
jgi:hypothetical protein